MLKRSERKDAEHLWVLNRHLNFFREGDKVSYHDIRRYYTEFAFNLLVEFKFIEKEEIKKSNKK